MEAEWSKKKILVAAVATALVTLGTAAHAAECYVGAGVGLSHDNRSGGKVLTDARKVLSDAGYAPAGGSGSMSDNNDTGFKFQGGCSLTQNFAVEGQLINTGRMTGRFSGITDGPEGASGTAVYESMGAGVGIVGKLPLSKEFSLLGKVGATYWRSEVTTSATWLPVGVTVNKTVKDSGVGAYYGAGLQYNLTPNAGIRIEWERARINSANSDMLTAGIVIGF